MGRVRPAAAIVATLLVAAGCTTEQLPDQAAPTTATPSTTAAAPVPPPLEWDDCDDGLECATLTVPLDHEDPSGETIGLAVARRASTGDEPIGALVLNPGGPGGSGITFLRNGGASGLLDHFDLVSWDPRGIGDSRPLDCASDPAFFALDPQPDDDAERAALEAAARAMADECAAADRELLPHLTTADTARDLEQLRRALGDAPLNYLGFSYGTHIGLRYAELFPTSIRAMALDGVVDPRETLTEFLTGQAVEIERVLGDNLTAYREVAARVEEQPLPSRAGPDVGPGILGVAAFASIYGAKGGQQLAAALDDARTGDGTALSRLAATYIGSASFAAYLGVLCVDGPRPETLADWWAFVDAIADAAPDLGASVGNEVIPCAFWPVAPDVERAPVTWPASLPPILLVASTQDAATPLDDAQRVHEALPRSVLLVRDGPGHTSFGASACVRDAVTRLLVDLVAPDEGTACPP